MTARGTIRVPGDKSISHRALIFGALATGESQISGILESADVRSTASVLRALGVRIPDLSRSFRFSGKGLGGLRQPGSSLDAGNSGMVRWDTAGNPLSTVRIEGMRSRVAAVGGENLEQPAGRGQHLAGRDRRPIDAAEHLARVGNVVGLLAVDPPPRVEPLFEIDGQRELMAGRKGDGRGRHGGVLAG